MPLETPIYDLENPIYNYATDGAVVVVCATKDSTDIVYMASAVDGRRGTVVKLPREDAIALGRALMALA